MYVSVNVRANRIFSDLKLTSMETTGRVPRLATAAGATPRSALTRLAIAHRHKCVIERVCTVTRRRAYHGKVVMVLRTAGRFRWVDYPSSKAYTQQ